MQDFHSQGVRVLDVYDGPRGTSLRIVVTWVSESIRLARAQFDALEDELENDGED